MAEAREWQSSTAVGDRGVDAVIRFLQTTIAKEQWRETRLIDPIDKTRYHQIKKTGDLRLMVRVDGEFRIENIEIKTDTTTSGNFFLETISNLEKRSEGAFTGCTADWYFYYFSNLSSLFILPVGAALEWFSHAAPTLRECTARSIRDNRYWRTRGRVVKIERLLKEVPGVFSFQETDGLWRTLPHLAK